MAGVKNQDLASEIEYLYNCFRNGWIGPNEFAKQLTVIRRKQAKHTIPYLGRLLPKRDLPILDIDTIIEARHLQAFTPETYKRRVMRKRLAVHAGLTNNNSSYFFRTQWEVWDIRMRCWHRDVNKELREQYFPDEVC
jgi:hypothetical protein